LIKTHFSVVMGKGPPRSRDFNWGGAWPSHLWILRSLERASRKRRCLRPSSPCHVTKLPGRMASWEPSTRLVGKR
jgi:hypothetical protein